MFFKNVSFILVFVIVNNIQDSKVIGYNDFATFVEILNSLISSSDLELLRDIVVDDEFNRHHNLYDVFTSTITNENIKDRIEQLKLIFSFYNLSELNSTFNNILTVVESFQTGSINDSLNICNDTLIKVLQADNFKMLRMLTSLYLNNIMPKFLNSSRLRAILLFAAIYFTEHQITFENQNNTYDLGKILFNVYEALWNYNNSSHQGRDPLGNINRESMREACVSIGSMFGFDEATATECFNDYADGLSNLFDTLLSNNK